MNSTITKRFLYPAFAAIIVMSSVPLCVSAEEATVNEINGQEENKGIFAGGTGTEADPFVITTEEQFRAFADSVNDGTAGGYADTAIRLDTDIDLEGDEWVPIGNMGDMENYSTIFMGSFDGNGHTISNLKLEEGDESVGVGLFGVITGSVSNLNISHFDVTVEGQSSQAIGAGVGYLMFGKIENVAADSCNVTGNNCTGIIVGGEQYATLKNLNVSDSTVTVINDNDFSDGRIIQIDIAEVGGLIVGGAFGGNIYDCSAQGTVKATGNEPVGMGGIGGCLELMDNIVNCDADVIISSPKGGHAIGGLCGYAGTHSDPNVTMEEFGMAVENYPAVIQDCDITVHMDVPGATHVGGLVGTGLYYFGEETAFSISDCSVKGEINGAVTPGSVAGRSEGCTITSVEADMLIDGEAAEAEVGTTDRMYESADQYEEDETDKTEADGMNGIFTAIVGENGTTYENFFDVTLAEENYDLWYDCTAAIVGESAAEDTVAFMQGYISSDRYGDAAIAYYDENPDAQTMFDCFYINGLKLVTFNPDNTITVQLEDGSAQTHSYEYLGSYNVGEGETMVYMGQEISVAFPCDVYKSTDEAGEFNYFFLRDDTMEETGHIEFRYGKDLEELQGYFTGPYAYWLTAGFDVDADEETLKNTVELFVLENMDYSSHSEEAITQLSDFIGTWNADLSAFGEVYADTELFFTIDEDGHGVTMMDGEQTADFEAYAYDNGEKGDGAGIYIAYSNLEYEAEAAAYTLETNDAGEMELTLYAEDGVISYKKVS